MRAIYLFLIAAVIACTSIVANARTVYANNRIVVRFKQGFKPVCTQRNHMVSFSISELDELNFKYRCIAAKRIGKYEKNPTFTYVLKFNDKVNIEQALQDYKATHYFEVIYVADKGSPE